MENFLIQPEQSSLSEFESPERFAREEGESSGENMTGLYEEGAVCTEKSKEEVPTCKTHKEKKAKYIVFPSEDFSFREHYCSSCAVEMAQNGEKVLKINEAMSKAQNISKVISR